ncbi:FAR1-related sequence 7 [Striga asiatica]|uniref:Protein FAR1-RELATED SEQUENCE n=1 Tax=Striga asiatica TaxID=4170 RepID=A0A5A7PW87_STRAF|nr:FAR1-related sequence 7 [Striga asiatica]
MLSPKNNPVNEDYGCVDWDNLEIQRIEAANIEILIDVCMSILMLMSLKLLGRSMISIIKEKETKVPTWFVIVLHGVFHNEFHVLRVSNDFFSCSCMMFESKGFICSHILRVFKFFDILELPDKFILSRWERKTKRFDHSKSKDIGHNFMEWNGRCIHCF